MVENRRNQEYDCDDSAANDGWARKMAQRSLLNGQRSLNWAHNDHKYDACLERKEGRQSGSLRDRRL